MIQPESGFVVKTKDKDGQKVFINMTQHELIDAFEEKPIPAGDREKFGGSETGIRIPLSLGTVREDFDKKNNPSQVYDVIWNPKTIERCKIDPHFRQVVVELAFNHIAQKHNHILDLRFIVPKMRYKGGTVQFQRVRAKKGPKIQEMEMTEEEKKKLEARGLEQQKMIEEVVEKTPDWEIYCVVGKPQGKDDTYYDEIYSPAHWHELIKTLIEKSDEIGVGDSKDRLNTLAETFSLPTEESIFEEFDGLNHEDAQHLVLLVNLPVIMRGHSIQLKYSRELLSIRVPTLYNLALGFPTDVEDKEDDLKPSVAAYFDCKLRKLIAVFRVKREAP